MSAIVYEIPHGIDIIKVDIGDNKKAQKQYDVNGFPGFGIFVNGVYETYTGHKDAGYFCL